MSHRELYREIEHELRAGRPVALATVIQTRGSTPRKEGSAMLVKADGSLSGTIGGGCGEAGVIQKAKLSLLDGRHREELADLTEDITLDSDAVCGGTLRVFIEPWRPDPPALELAARLKALAEQARPVVTHQIVTAPEGAGEAVGRRIVTTPAGERVLAAAPAGFDPPSLPGGLPGGQRARLARADGYEVFSECWEPAPRLVIVGAGHIAESLESLGRLAGFETTVLDDRRMFANRQRFPNATEVVCGPILDAVRSLPLTPVTHLVLVTRGHVLDLDALRVLIERGEPVAYVGMIGSKRRVRGVFQLLERQGFARERFRHVHAPIGLNIAAETPAEIAVSIMAEIIAVRRHAGEDTRSMSGAGGIHAAPPRAARAD